MNKYSANLLFRKARAVVYLQTGLILNLTRPVRSIIKTFHATRELLIGGLLTEMLIKIVVQADYPIWESMALCGIIATRSKIELVRRVNPELAMVHVGRTYLEFFRSYKYYFYGKIILILIRCLYEVRL